MSRSQRLLIVLTTAVLVVTAIISFVAAVFFIRSIIFNEYELEILAQIATIIFLPLISFCIAILGTILLTRQDKPKNKRKK